MPRFRIVEKVTEYHWVNADTAQEALSLYLNKGSEDAAVEDEFYCEVEDRHIEDETGAVCDVEDL